MATKDYSNIKSQITATLQTHAGISPAKITGVLPVKDLQGKIYEAFVLSRVIENLVVNEHCSIRLVDGGSGLRLKQKGSPINRTYPYFEVFRAGPDGAEVLLGELFTDTEFSGISHELRGGGTLRSGDYHELDIAMFQPHQKGRPSYKAVMLAVECKATAVKKSTFREVLGFRRELSMLTNVATDTHFNSWPVATVPVGPAPASAHLLYTTDRAAVKYVDNAIKFGVQVIVEKM